jgi:hypothetical protein
VLGELVAEAGVEVDCPCEVGLRFVRPAHRLAGHAPVGDDVRFLRVQVQAAIVVS